MPNYRARRDEVLAQTNLVDAICHATRASTSMIDVNAATELSAPGKATRRLNFQRAVIASALDYAAPRARVRNADNIISQALIGRANSMLDRANAGPDRFPSERCSQFACCVMVSLLACFNSFPPQVCM